MRIGTPMIDCGGRTHWYGRGVIRNVIFDWSGTLVDDLPAVLEATNHVLRMAGVPEITRERFRAEFTLPFTGFYDRYTPHVPLAQLEQWFHARFSEVQDSVEELPHARRFLEFCRAMGLKTLLLSAIHPDLFTAQIRANRFDEYLEHRYLGVWDKRKKIHEILEAHVLAPGETVFIGDMEHDVETAKTGGVHSVGVLTGYNTVQQLRNAGPDLIVEHLGELGDVLRRNGMRLTPAERDERRIPVVTVGAAVFDDTGRVLMIRTHKWSGLWGIPGGKVKWGEGSETALRQELREETGLEVADVRFVLVQDCLHSTEFYRDEHFVLLNYRCRAASTGPVILNEEAEEYRWLPVADAMAMPLNQPTRVLLEAIAALPGGGVA